MMQLPSLNKITQPFGYDPSYPLNNGNHKGVDFSAKPDNKIYAPEDGTYELRPNDGTLGNSLHMFTNNRHHAFGHTSSYLISNKQSVKRGTPIAIMGATGAATGPHLHWALTVNNILVDPLSQVNEDFIKEGDKEMIKTEEDNRQLFLDVVGRNPYKQEVGRYVGWELNKAREDIRKNGDRQNINKMMESYYQNGSTIPAGLDIVPVTEQLYRKK